MKTVYKSKAKSLLGFAALLAIGVTASAETLAASLRHHIVVKGETVKLGDIFTDAGKHAERVVLQAPGPGRRVTLNVQWLYRAARSYGVKWKPLSRLDQVVVERATHRISTDQIRVKLAAGIRNELINAEKLEIDLDNRLLQMHLPGEAIPTLKIQTLQIDRQTQRFTAVLVGAEQTSRPSRLTATGRFYRLVDVPVLVRRMRGNEVIAPEDIRLVTYRADKIDMNSLHDPEDLIGMSPKRGLSADRPIRRSDVRAPVLVPKGSIVTMVFKTDRMLLTAQGKALQDGSKGDTIRILNARTHKTIDGLVTGSGQVKVLPIGRVALK